MLLLVDIIWIGVISHSITNFQGRKNSSFTSVADPPLIFRPNWGLKDWKVFFGDQLPPLSKGLDDRPPPPPKLMSRSGSGTALVSQVSRAGLNNHADNFAWTSLKVLWCWRVYLRSVHRLISSIGAFFVSFCFANLLNQNTMFALFLEFGARTLS